jgi:bla regulator protein BlaR1
MKLLFLQQLFSNVVLKALCWTLIHSLWQGLLAAILAGIIIITTRKSAAQLRYNLLGCVLFLFLITTVITFFLYKEGNIITGKMDIILPVITETSFVTPNNEIILIETSPAGKIVAFFNTNANFFVLLWAIFFLIHCINLLTGLAGIRRMKNYKTHKLSEEWNTKLNDLSKRLGINQSIQLLQSELVKIPVAVGFFKPVIFIPLGLLSHLPSDQAETILLHELAHIRRKDYLVNLLQRFGEAIFFFNPAVLWISSLIRQEREACCDDIVIANTTHKGSYLEALVSFQEYSFTPSTYAMAISSKRHYLLNRVRRMITRENKKLNLMEKLLLLAGMTTVMAFTFIPQTDIPVKKQPAVVAIKEPVELKMMPAPPPPPTVPIAPPKPLIKKEIRKPVLVNVIKSDTVPVPEKVITKDEVSFPSISSTVNDDGKTRTETTTATDQSGKKYTITKLNNRVTSLTIDGKNIPENEIKNHESLFRKIESVREENKVRRQKDMERRREDLAERAQERKILMEENRKQRELYNKKRKEYSKEREKERTMRLKEMEKNRKKKIKSEPDGKEVIRQDIKIESSKEINIRKTPEINTDVTVNIQKRQVITKNTNVNFNKESTINLQNNIEIRKPLFKKTNTNLFLNKNIDSKSAPPLKPTKKSKSPNKYKPVPKAKPVTISGPYVS